MTGRFTAKAELVWYVGKQNDDNSLDALAPYLYALPPPAAKRCRCAAHLASITIGDRALTVVYYVDPKDRHIYAQPHPDSDGFRYANWGLARPAQRDFEDARTFARALFRRPDAEASTQYERWWNRYAAGEMPHLPPQPLDIPSDPARAYQGAGWKSFEDWLVVPKKKDREKQKASKKKKARAATAGRVVSHDGGT